MQANRRAKKHSDRMNKGSIKNILHMAGNEGSLEILLKAITAVGIAETLATGGLYTLFAPCDEAFEKLPNGFFKTLLKDKQRLKEVLLHHVIEGYVLSDALVNISEARTLQGSFISIGLNNGLRINDAAIVTDNIAASNGVIHVIDRVLFPDEKI